MKDVNNNYILFLVMENNISKAKIYFIELISYWILLKTNINGFQDTGLETL